MKQNSFATMMSQFDETWLIFGPNTNMAFSLNKTGKVYQWPCVKEGASETGMIEKYSDVTEGQTGHGGGESFFRGPMEQISAVRGINRPESEINRLIQHKPNPK